MQLACLAREMGSGMAARVSAGALGRSLGRAGGVRGGQVAPVPSFLRALQRCRWHGATPRHRARSGAGSTDHAARQAVYFRDKVQDLGITPAVEAKLERIAGIIPDLPPEPRAIDVGSGTGALIPHLQARTHVGGGGDSWFWERRPGVRL